MQKKKLEKKERKEEKKETVQAVIRSFYRKETAIFPRPTVFVP